MIIVTGAAGFIGSNLVAALNERGDTDLAVCDRLGQDLRWQNLRKRMFREFVFPEDLMGFLEKRGDVTAVLHDGRRVHVFVEHAIGSLQRPMSDAALADKFAAQADPVLGAVRTAELIAACRRLGTMEDVRELTALARP